jgi:hypothetical protein
VSVSVPIDTITTPAAGSDANAAPGQTPINEVRGARQEGPGASNTASGAATPLAPSTGSGVAANDNTSSSPFALLAIVLGLAFLGTPVAAYASIQLNRSSKR